MGKENILKTLSFDFSIRVINLGKFLVESKKEFIISKQIIRSGISIGANIYESVYAESKADFIHKLSISLKETSETEYWIELLFRTKYLTENEYNSNFQDLFSIKKLLITIIKKLKNKNS